MTHEQLNKILFIAKADPEYQSVKKDIYTLINEFRCASGKDIPQLEYKLTEYAGKGNLPRRRMFGTLHEIIQELQSIPEYPEELYDLLTNYADSLEGYCSPNSIIRLEGDPTDVKLLSDFVRSYKWIDTEFFKLE